MSQPISPSRSKFAGALPVTATWIFVFLLGASDLLAQSFFPLKDVRPGLHGVGRTVFQGDRIEEFQVEILGVLENIAPKQSIILAKLSGGPLAETGILQGMSGSPVYIDGKLVGAVALGFPFSKEPIAGIQPIEQMVADATFQAPTRLVGTPAASRSSLAGNLAQILTPLSLSGFTPETVEMFSAQFRKLGFEPQQGVSSGSPKSPDFSGSVQPGSMISVQLMSGDYTVSADGTVTYADGKRIYAFGHRFLGSGSTEMPFARADVVALLPTLNTSTKISVPREWVGTMLSDRSTAIAGEVGRPARMIPLSISVKRPAGLAREYHMHLVNDRLLTPFMVQTAIFSSLDATERTLGAGTLRLSGRVDFEDGLSSLNLRDIFVSDNALGQQVAADAVVELGFVLSSAYSSLRIKEIFYRLESVEAKQQLRLTQVWTDAPEVHPGESVRISALFRGDDGREVLEEVTYAVPVGASTGPLNFTVSDANTVNFPEFAGLSPSSFATAEQLIETLNRYRGANAAYVRVWRQEPSFSIAGPLPGGELSDPPPSVMLVLADPSSSAATGASPISTRGSEVTEIKIPLDGYVVTGAKTVQVEVKE